jgi:hypothetical protein
MRSWFLCLFMLGCVHPAWGLAPEEKLVNNLIRSFAQEQKKRTGWTLEAIGSAIPNKVHGFILHFQSTQKLTLEAARPLYLEAMRTFIAKVNADVKIRPYLATYPITIDQVNLLVSFYDEKGGHMAPPFIDFICSGKRSVLYCQWDAKNDTYCNESTEPWGGGYAALF